MDSNVINIKTATTQSKPTFIPQIFDKTSWPYFLQHLPLKGGPVLDYKGNPVAFQQKHAAIVNYDIGTQYLQQCADALMRLRAEYLFSRQRYSEIGFHFVSGEYYTWDAYCKGIKVVPSGNRIKMVSGAASAHTHESLRRCLNIVHDYASTISLAKELHKTDEFGVGTIVIHPGSPGHCFIVVDEATDISCEKVFRFVEGYSPAQSIYVLSNLEEPGISPWYHLQKGVIATSSCRFMNYQLGKFE